MAMDQIDLPLEGVNRWWAGSPRLLGVHIHQIADVLPDERQPTGKRGGARAPDRSEKGIGERIRQIEPHRAQRDERGGGIEQLNVSLNAR